MKFRRLYLYETPLYVVPRSKASRSLRCTPLYGGRVVIVLSWELESGILEAGLKLPFPFSVRLKRPGDHRLQHASNTLKGTSRYNSRGLDQILKFNRSRQIFYWCFPRAGQRNETTSDASETSSNAEEDIAASVEFVGDRFEGDDGRKRLHKATTAHPSLSKPCASTKVEENIFAMMVATPAWYRQGKANRDYGQQLINTNELQSAVFSACLRKQEFHLTRIRTYLRSKRSQCPVSRRGAP